MFFGMRLTDESIKQYMSETSYSTWKPVLAFFAVGIIGFGGAFLFVPYRETIANVYSVINNKYSNVRDGFCCHWTWNETEAENR